MSVVSTCPYIFINNQVESITPCWKDIVLQWSGAVVCVDHMAWLQETLEKHKSINKKNYPKSLI